MEFYRKKNVAQDDITQLCCVTCRKVKSIRKIFTDM